MRENFYRLLREYVIALRDRDVSQEQLRAASEEEQRDEARRNFERLAKRCRELRREIRRYPDVSAMDAPPDSSRLNYRVQAR